MMRFAGTLSGTATLTVGGNPGIVRADNSFEGYAPVTSGAINRIHTGSDPRKVAISAVIWQQMTVKMK